MIVAEEQTVLELRHVTKLYVGAVVLEDVSLTTQRGEVHGLIGKNRAGKSTLTGIISGLVAPNSGKIWINGQKYASLPSITTKHQYIPIITREPQVIEESTVTENFFMPGYPDSKKVINQSEIWHRVAEILDQVGFPIGVSVKMRNSSTNERQPLLVIKARFVEDVEIIITGEVSTPLSQKDQAILYHIIDDLISARKTVVFISHHTGELLRAYDRVIMIWDGHNVGSVMRGGLDKKKLASLVVSSTNYDEQVMEDMSAMVQKEEAFVLKNFTDYGKFRNISTSVRRGEIVGLADLQGSGRTELMRSMVGIGTYDGGTVWVAGSQKHYRFSATARGDDVLYLTEERGAEGLIPIASIRKNLTISVLPKISRWGVLQTKKEEQLTGDLVRTLDVKAFPRGQNTGQFNGGSKQRVLVGEVMAYIPQICLLDEPTRGIDIEAKESILNTVHCELRKQSCIITTSSGAEDLIKICDRTLVLYEGEIIDQFSRGEPFEKQTYRAIQGEVTHINEVRKS